MYPPFPVSWQMVIRPCVTFPARPLKFRTAGFPQYGFKLNFGGDLRRYPTYTPPRSVSRREALVAPVSGRFRVQSASPSSYPGPSVQRPLAPRRVLLSRRLLAYYGLIRASRPLLSAYFLRPAGLCPSGQATERVPNLLCVSVPSCRLPYPGRPRRPLVTVPWPSALAFANPVVARHLHSRAHRFSRVRYRGCKVRFMLRPERLLALHRKGLLHPSFHLPSRLQEASSIATRANSQFPRPVFHRQDAQHYGLQARVAKRPKGPFARGAQFAP